MSDVAAVDTYIAAQPVALQPALQALRAQIRALVPTAVESIAYGMPTYRLGGYNLVHFAAFKRHLSLFPGTGVCQALAAEYGALIHGASTIKLPLDTVFPQPVVAAALQQGLRLFAENGGTA